MSSLQPVAPCIFLKFVTYSPPDRLEIKSSGPRGRTERACGASGFNTKEYSRVTTGTVL